MKTTDIFNNIKASIASAPRNQRTTEIHVQMIKYGDNLMSMSSKEFCDMAGLPVGYISEFSKMRNMIDRLKAAGLDIEKL